MLPCEDYVKQAKKYVNAMRGHRKKSDHFPHYDLTAEEVDIGNIVIEMFRGWTGKKSA